MSNTNFFQNALSYTVLSVCLISGAYFATNANAADDAGLKIAVVDSMKIVESSKVYQDVRSQIEKQRDVYSEATQKDEGALKKKFQELEAQKNVLSEKDKKEKSTALAQEVNALQEKAAKDGSILENAIQTSMTKINDTMTKSIEKEAKDKKYDIVIDKAAVPYYKKDIDITSAVLEAVDKDMPSLKVNFNLPDAPKSKDSK